MPASDRTFSSNSEFISFARENYRYKFNTADEFQKDLKTFLYIKKIFSRYKTTGKIHEKLALNHIKVLYNSFEDATTTMLFHKLDQSYHDILWSFLVFMGKEKASDELKLDEFILKELHKSYERRI